MANMRLVPVWICFRFNESCKHPAKKSKRVHPKKMHAVSMAVILFADSTIFALPLPQPARHLHLPPPEILINCILRHKRRFHPDRPAVVAERIAILAGALQLKDYHSQRFRLRGPRNSVTWYSTTHTHTGLISKDAENSGSGYPAQQGGRRRRFRDGAEDAAMRPPVTPSVLGSRH